MPFSMMMPMPSIQHEIFIAFQYADIRQHAPPHCIAK